MNSIRLGRVIVLAFVWSVESVFGASIEDKVLSWADNQFSSSFIYPAGFDATRDGAFAAYRAAEVELPPEALSIAIRMLTEAQSEETTRKLGLVGVIALLERKHGSTVELRTQANALIAQELENVTKADDWGNIGAILMYFRDFGTPNVRSAVAPLQRHRISSVRLAADMVIEKLPKSAEPEKIAIQLEAVNANGVPQPVRPDPTPKIGSHEAPEVFATSPSSGFLWTGAGVTIALIVGLAFFWKRRI